MSQRSSSRWVGSLASAPLLWSMPRSSTSTSMFLSVSWRAARPAVRPPPTMTTVLLGKLVDHASGSSAEVGDRLGILRARKRLAAELHHVDACGSRAGRDSRPSSRTPCRVAAVDRIGEAGLREQRIDQLVEPGAERQRASLDLAGCRDRRRNALASRGGSWSNGLPCLRDAGGVGGRDAGLEVLLGRQRQLVALLRLALLPRPAGVALRSRGRSRRRAGGRCRSAGRSRRRSA